MRITGRQLRRIIQEEVGRMMNEEDAGTTPAIPGYNAPVQVRKQSVYSPASPAEAQAQFDKTLAAGKVREIPGVGAIERDTGGTRAGGLAVPENFQNGVFTFNVTLAKSLMKGVEVRTDKVVSVVIDGQPNREAMQSLSTNPYLDTATKRTYGFEGITGPNAKMTLTCSSVEDDSDEGYAVMSYRNVTVKSVKFEAL